MRGRDGGAVGSEGGKASPDGGSHLRDASSDLATDALAVLDAEADAAPVGGSRPVHLHVPSSYQPGQAVPLVMMLHGYSVSGPLEELYLQLTPQSDAHGFIYAYPDGTIDSQGLRFWNATDACCNLDGSSVDDSTYLSQVITELQARYSIDPKRVFLVGHSNGGFMAYRMACDHADQIAAIVSLAGAMWEDEARCMPSAAVSVVEIHGTADTVIAYDGGSIQGHTFPSAPTTVSDWVGLDGCSTTPDTANPDRDLDSVLPGAETTVTTYNGCRSGGDVELWSIQGGAHIPTLTSSFAPDVIAYLLAHPKS